MCGIAGVYFNQKKKKKELEIIVSKMVQQQVNRGPDDSGIFIDAKNNIAFGHNRLAIIDLSKSGHQPMKFGDLWITFNGEIYNFLELKKGLEKKGYKFKTKTDTEVILALYSAYGEKSFLMLRGMFAFGLWDGKEKKLFLVKDRYGIKPLYYFSDNEKLIFASTVKTLAESGLVPLKKNPDAMLGFLLFGSVPLPMTTIQNILAVPAGHYLVLEQGNRKKLVEYYNPLAFFENKKEIEFYEAQKNVRNILEESLNLHLISDAPLGIFLSGGLDSSAIAALAAKNREKPITTLSVIFDEPEFSEQEYQRAVAKKIKSDHREIKITAKDFNDSLEEIFKTMDQPTIDGINTFFIAKAAKKAGLKTVLSGLGADEIFLGYPHFKKAELMRRIQKFPEILKLPLKLGAFFGGRYSKLSYFIDNDILSFYLGLRGLFSPQETAKILGIDLKDVQDFLQKFYDSFFASNNASFNALHPVNLLSFLEMKLYLQNQLLKDTDFMSMHHSVEVRVPFLDHPLVEYLSSLSPKLKLSNDVSKPLLVDSVRNLLPAEILSRKKMGFTFPFQKWLSSDVKGQMLNIKTHWSRYWAKVILEKF
ncbi:MAG: asparagine synthase (glutamine-hydrolyzing) [Patescibacteria group bacterium]